MERIVDFNEYCSKCKFFKTPENEEPCDACLDEPVNEDSAKPVKFTPKEN